MWSLIVGGLILGLSWWLIWRLTTDSDKANQAISVASGNFLEIGLYKDHPRPMLASLRDLNRSSLKLGWILLPPSLVFMLPLALVGVYLWSYLAFRPALAGESVLVRLPSAETGELQLSPPVDLEAGPLRTREATFWRVRATEEGSFKIRAGDYETVLVVKDGWAGTRGVLGELEVLYPRRDIWLGTWKVHWALAVFLSFLLGLLATSKVLPPRKRRDGK